MHAVADRQSGADGTLGVVTVGGRRAEDAHHGIADEFLDHAAEGFDLPADGLVVRRQDRAHVFGIEPLGAGREADEIDEQDADEPPLLLRGRLVHAERGPTREAEARDVGVVLTASGAKRHTLRVRRDPAGAAFSGRSPCLAPGHALSGHGGAAAQKAQPP